MNMILKDKKLLSFILMFALFIFLFYASIPFLNAFFGALILFVIFKPLNRKLKNKFKFSKSLAAWSILLISSIIIILPLFFLIQGLISQISTLPEVITSIDKFEDVINTISSLRLEIKTDTIINQQTQGNIIILNQTDFSFILPYKQKATNIICYNPRGYEIINENIEKITLSPKKQNNWILIYIILAIIGLIIIIYKSKIKPTTTNPLKT